MPDPARPDRALPEIAATIGATIAADAAQRLLDTFTRATVFSPAPPTPGVTVLESAGLEIVPVFSDLRLLARFNGPGAWFGTSGLDLLGLLPVGVRVVLDPNGPHPLLIDPAAAALEYAVIAH
ncbi:MAG TPA: SseB family protein [Mycobacteriales bacterium]|nr:SseB family protein [Mycobacteriales bacterium]